MGLGQGSAKRLSEWSVSAAQFPCRPLSTASYDGGIAQLIQTEIGVETPTDRRRKDTHTELEEERHGFMVESTHDDDEMCSDCCETEVWSWWSEASLTVRGSCEWPH